MHIHRKDIQKKHFLDTRRPFQKQMAGAGVLDSLNILSDQKRIDNINIVLDTLKTGTEALKEIIYAPSGVKESSTLFEEEHKNPEARPGFLGEKHMLLPSPYGLTRANYAGPGTNLNKRLIRGDPPVDGPRGIDAAAKIHDIDYSNARTVKDVRRADNIFIKRVRDSDQSGLAKNIVISAIKAKKIGENIGIFRPDTFTELDMEGEGGDDPMGRLKNKILKRKKKIKQEIKKSKLDMILSKMD